MAYLSALKGSTPFANIWFRWGQSYHANINRWKTLRVVKKNTNWFFSCSLTSCFMYTSICLEACLLICVFLHSHITGYWWYFDAQHFLSLPFMPAGKECEWSIQYSFIWIVMVIRSFSFVSFICSLPYSEIQVEINENHENTGWQR